MRNFSGDSLFLGVIFFLAVGFSVSSGLSSDGFSLLALKAAIFSGESEVLGSWSESDSSPCRWGGVTCDHNRRVTGVSLSNGNFSGYIPSELGALSSLLSLDLSHNFFSGPLPPQITALTNLTHLDLSSNFLNGSLPPELNALSNLAGTLNLSYNTFSGEVPASYGRFPVALSLDLRHNNLSGKIPAEGSLLNQGPTAFSGNPYLCGSATVSLISGVSIVVGVVFLSLWVLRKKWNLTEGKTRKETLGMTTEGPTTEEGQKGKYIAVDEGFALELEDLLRASAYVVGKSRMRRLSEGDATWRFKEFESEVEAIGRVHHPNILRLRAYYYASDEKLLVTDFICNGSLRNALHGKTSLIFDYLLFCGSLIEISKNAALLCVLMSVNLSVFITRNLEECCIIMDIRLCVLILCVFMSVNCSVFVTRNLEECFIVIDITISGGPGVSLPTLSWPGRLKIAQGIARGLVHIHECSPKRYIHGNIKSSKILLDDELQPYISGFGLTRLVSNASRLTSSASKKMSSANQATLSPRSSTSPSLAYKAPEARVSGSKLTQKCDVYSFGVVLLEILTGRVPEGGPDEDGKGLEDTVRKVFQDERPLSEIIDPALLHEFQSKKQVVATFHIALNCTEFDPECRPRMRTVAESLERIGLQ
nr:receptor protein kinase-like protein ZAR1 [Ipomoea batatas]